jgi:ankyrin repeat protein
MKFNSFFNRCCNASTLRLAVVTLTALAWSSPVFAQPDYVFHVGSAGWMPLHEAALNDRMAVAESLLASNAEVNAKEELGATPLHVAAWRGSTDMVELLLTNKANVNAKTIWIAGHRRNFRSCGKICAVSSSAFPGWTSDGVRVHGLAPLVNTVK